ncbi:MAG: ECF transporter S component [Anaerovoracaceae bacterium]
MKQKTNKLALSGILAAAIIIATMFVKIPIPFTQGYVHLGDAIIFISFFALGWKYAAAVAAIGSAMGDILGGFAAWAPWTLVIKGFMVLVVGIIISIYKRGKSRENHKPAKENINLEIEKSNIVIDTIAMFVGGIVMTTGYFFAEGIMYGNWAAALLGIPWNIGQFVVGIIIALISIKAIEKRKPKYLQ